MAFRSICVTDTNLWIDLDTADLLGPIFRLPFEWQAPDVIVAELERPEAADLIRRGLRVRELGGRQVAEVVRLAAAYPRPSRADLFALVLARLQGVLLLTGDRHLRQAAEQEGVQVHGTLWLLDEMVERSVVTPREAAEALIRLKEGRRRLPADEVDRRLRRWQTGA
jgi:predicted nucleic acid-binding protein